MSIINKKQGQMLIEALIALSVVVMVLVGLLSAAVVSVRNSRYSQNVILANQYCQEALETVRQKRDQAVNWSAFITDYDGAECMDGSESCSPCPSFSVSPNVGIFYRCLYIDNSLEDKAIVTAYVAWQENGINHQSKLDTFLSKWSK